MPNYVDNIDIIDANNSSVNVLLKDRETASLANSNKLEIGILNNLTTTDKSSLVGATNEVNSLATNAKNKADSNKNEIGDLSNLTTTDKSSLVGATNEVNSLATYAKNKADSNKSEIGVLSNLTTADKTSLVSAINEINSTPNNKRNIICIGDSYGQWIDGTSQSWISRLRDCLPNLNNFYHNEAGGAGFLGDYYGGTTYKSFKDLLEDIENNVPNKDTITDIIVAGGYNDLSGGHTYIANLPTALADFVTYVNATYPNAKISVGFIARSSDPSICASLINETYFYYQECCKNEGIIYLSDSEIILHSDSMMSPNDTPMMHPNDIGSVALGNGLSQLLNGQKPSFYSKLGVSLVNANFASSVVLSEIITNDEITYTLNNEHIELTNAVTFNMDNSFVYNLGEIDTPYIHAFDSPKIPVGLIIGDNVPTFYDVNGCIYIENKTLKLAISKTISNTWGSINVKHLFIRGFSITLNKREC